jgi:hypothetical protein
MVAADGEQPDRNFPRNWLLLNRSSSRPALLDTESPKLGRYQLELGKALLQTAGGGPYYSCARWCSPFQEFLNEILIVVCGCAVAGEDDPP